MAIPCDGCRRKPPVCYHWHDRKSEPSLLSNLCSDCCGHSGEEGECYRISDGRPMSDLSDEEIAADGDP